MKRRETIEKEIESLKRQLNFYNLKYVHGLMLEKTYLFYKHVFEDSIKALEWTLEEEE